MRCASMSSVGTTTLWNGTILPLIVEEYYISRLFMFLSSGFHCDEAHKQTQNASYLDRQGGQLTRQILGLTRLVGRVVEITGVMRVFKLTINWTPNEAARVTFYSIFLAYDRDLVCSEMLARV